MNIIPLSCHLQSFIEGRCLNIEHCVMHTRVCGEGPNPVHEANDFHKVFCELCILLHFVTFKQ